MIKINHRFLRWKFGDALHTVARNDRIPQDADKLLKAYTTIGTLRDIFPDLSGVSLFWNPNQQRYELTWGLDISKHVTTASAMARLSTLMRQWEGEKLE